MTVPTVYLAHPVSAPTRLEVAHNLDGLRGWVDHLVRHTDWALCVPWLAYVETFHAEAEFRERGLRDDLANLERCDAIALCGWKLSPGMEVERDHAIKCGLQVIDLIAPGVPVDRTEFPTVTARPMVRVW